LDLSSFNSDFVVFLLLLLSLIISSLCAVMIRNLLKAAIALASTSAILTIVMFILNSPWAAVFELSVCAGLITVVLISAISLTGEKPSEEIVKLKKKRLQRFMILPLILVVATALLWISWPYLSNWVPKIVSSEATFQEALWNIRQLDILGQIIIILAGVFGIVVLFKEREVK
jgi:NADH-quinone oxidoreductase subunit J